MLISVMLSQIFTEAFYTVRVITVSLMLMLR